MNLIHLKYFFDAAKNGSMTKAADINYVTRPAISQAIRSLESTLGIKLVTHKKRDFILTNEGQWLYDRCSSLINHVEDIKNGISESSAIISGQLKIGCSRSVAATFLPDLLKKMGDLHPSVAILMRLGTSSEITKMIENREIDIGIMIVDNDQNIHKSHVHYSGSFACVVAKKIKAQSMFLLTEKRPEIEILEKKLGGFKNTPVLEIASWDLIAMYAAKGLGIGLVPDFFLNTEVGSKLQLFPKIGSLHRYFLISRVSRETPATRAFLSLMKTIKASSKTSILRT